MSSLLFSQENRSIDGSNNNLQNPTLGAVESLLQARTTISFSDNIAYPNGESRPNPRTISNILFSQTESESDKLALSDYVWVFGQFVDHDLTLVRGDDREPMLIQVPSGDPFFDPFNTGLVVIPMFRSLGAFGTGTDSSNPRRYQNGITMWVDGSNVYGSTQERADWLRTFEGGKLKMSNLNLLPFNTMNGEFNANIDANAPEMDDELHSNSKLFVAGDSRANENTLLIAVHTLFVREHNRLAEDYGVKHPDWSDEKIYQKARKMVIGFIQSILYDEWLPAMGVHLEPYSAYDESIDASVSNVFSAAAFRLGHTLLSGEIIRLNNDGSVIAQGNTTLRDAFFNPKSVLLEGGIEPLFKGMGTQIEQALDCKIVDDVRNFLFGPPGAGGLDLAAINIMRGRERGLADFNTIRADMGLPRFNSFDELCQDPECHNILKELYQDINNIDPWVGMLAENHMDEALFGETIMAIMLEQFGNLRDGDRFYYENDSSISEEEKKLIKDTKFSDLVRANTSITLMQDDVFKAMDHENIPFAMANVSEIHLDIAAFPNPTIDYLNVKAWSRTNGHAEFRLIDATGKMQDAGTFNFNEGENTFTVNMHNLDAGTYFVYLEMGKEYGVRKVVRAN